MISPPVVPAIACPLVRPPSARCGAGESRDNPVSVLEPLTFGQGSVGTLPKGRSSDELILGQRGGY